MVPAIDLEEAMLFSREFLARDMESTHRHVLILEDDLTFKQLWLSVINKCCPDAQIDWVVTAEAAEKCVKIRHKQGNSYDLIIADVFLSGRKTGIDLWKKFGSHFENFIFVSSLEKEKFDMLVGNEEHSYPLFLQKPLRPRDCTALVENLLST